MQVGSMIEELQIKGCYKIYFYLHQPGNSVLEKDTSTQNN